MLKIKHANCIYFSFLFYFLYLGFLLYLFISMNRNIFFSIFFCFFLLSSCAHENQVDLTTVIFDIETSKGFHCGKGIQIDPTHIFTSKHIIESRTLSDLCNIIKINWERSKIISIEKNPISDSAILEISKQNPNQFQSIRYPSQSKIIKDLPVFFMVSRAGSWVKISGKITNVSTSYLGYDSSLKQDKTYTWAVETDILLDPWESGSPVWTLSGELLWVVSAVYEEGKRSYIVPIK